MRPYSLYLNELKSEGVQCKYHMAGSTPPASHIWRRRALRVSTLESAWVPEFASVHRRLAALVGAREDEVTLCPGASQSMFQLLAALTSPGDRVVLETPVYEPFVAVARFLALRVSFYRRRGSLAEEKAELRRLCGPRGRRGRGAKLLLISNPHCPTGHVYTGAELGWLARLGPQLVVDEVFLPIFAGGAATSVRPADRRRVISVGGLSKSLGLSSLRVGWVCARRAVIERVRRIGYDLNIDMPTPSVQLADVALREWHQLVGDHIRLADRNRRLVQRFAARVPGAVWGGGFERGYFFMVKVPARFRGSGRAFAAELLRSSSVWLRAGEGFAMPGYVRVQVLLPPKDFARAWAAVEGWY